MPDASTRTLDLLVVGSGAGGLVAALTARRAGLAVAVVEKSRWYGGSTALSGGGIWVPNNPALLRAGIEDDEASVLAYLDALTRGHVAAERLRALVRRGPEMMRFLEGTSPHLRFAHVPGYSDYHPELPGGRPEGRTVEALPFDLRRLGALARSLRRSPLAGPRGIYLTEEEYAQVAMVRRTPAGRRVAARLVARAVGDRVRGRHVVALGQALVGRLRLALADEGVPVWLETGLRDLRVDDGRVVGAALTRDDLRLDVRATRGVVLATGGFDHDQALRDAHLPPVAAPDASGGAATNTGDGLRAALALGAATDLMDSAWWMPVVRLPSGRVQVLVSERCIPGSLVVDPRGHRFTNECAPYVDFVRRQVELGHREVWLVMDSRARSRYPFAGILPLQPFPSPWYDAGLVHRAGDLDGLAARTGMDPATLRATVERFNGHALRGVDPDHGRDRSAYDRYYGDPTLPSPTLAPLTRAPYYAIRMLPGDLGTNGGVVTDEQARVLTTDGAVVPGLYATGNVTASAMGEDYAGAGATIGPAMTFGWIAARHAAGITRARQPRP